MVGSGELDLEPEPPILQWSRLTSLLKRSKSVPETAKAFLNGHCLFPDSYDCGRV